MVGSWARTSPWMTRDSGEWAACSRLFSQLVVLGDMLNRKAAGSNQRWSCFSEDLVENMCSMDHRLWISGLTKQNKKYFWPCQLWACILGTMSMPVPSRHAQNSGHVQWASHKIEFRAFKKERLLEVIIVKISSVHQMKNSRTDFMPNILCFKNSRFAPIRSTDEQASRPCWPQEQQDKVRWHLTMRNLTQMESPLWMLKAWC